MRTRRRGFGVLENLIALGVVGVVVLALSAGLSSSGAGVRRDQVRLGMHRLAGDVLAILVSRPRAELRSLLPALDQPRSDVLPALIGQYPALAPAMTPPSVGGVPLAVQCRATRSEPLPGRLEAVTVTVDWSLAGRHAGDFTLFRLRRIR